MNRLRRLRCRLTSHQSRTYALTNNGLTVVVEHCDRCHHQTTVMAKVSNRQARRAKKAGRAFPAIREIPAPPTA